MINVYTFGPRIASLHSENHIRLAKHPDFGPILFFQIRPRDPFGRPHLGPFSPRPLQTNALKPNTFALGNQTNVPRGREEHMFTFSSTCCVKPSGGHDPQQRNTNFRELERDDDDFGLIWTLSFGALVLWFCIPSVLAPGMGRFDPPSGPLLALLWPPESVQGASRPQFDPSKLQKHLRAPHSSLLFGLKCLLFCISSLLEYRNC